MSRGDDYWQARVSSAREAGDTHPCCVPGCAAETLHGFLACRTHYLTLPRKTRYVLGLAFKGREERPDLYDEATRLARQLLTGMTPCLFRIVLRDTQ